MFLPLQGVWEADRDLKMSRDPIPTLALPLKGREYSKWKGTEYNKSAS